MDNVGKRCKKRHARTTPFSRSAKKIETGKYTKEENYNLEIETSAIGKQKMRNTRFRNYAGVFDQCGML